MNERMLELLVQSGLLINVSEHRVNELDPNIEKFARLLIQTCANYAEYQLQIGGTNADKIKQHFGVK